MSKNKFGITYYTTKEALILIGRSKTAVLGWIKQGLIADVHKNQIKHRVWLEEDIKRFADFAKDKLNNSPGRR
jgi:hypothetical protein